ncbi:hypothetical protein GCM10020295_47680 [Streptomyces cinereospinus]
MARVPAQPGQGDEHALRVGDDAGAAGRLQSRVPHPGGGRGKVLQGLAAGLEQYGRFGDVEGDAVTGTFEGATQGVLGGGRFRRSRKSSSSERMGPAG